MVLFLSRASGGWEEGGKEGTGTVLIVLQSVVHTAYREGEEFSSSRAVGCCGLDIYCRY